MAFPSTNEGMSVRYKTKFCKMHMSDGNCTFGDRCCFAHNETEMVQGKLLKILDDHPTMMNQVKQTLIDRSIITSNVEAKPLLVGASDDILRSKISLLESENARMILENEKLSLKLSDIESGLKTTIKLISSLDELATTNKVTSTMCAEETDKTLLTKHRSWNEVLKPTDKT